MHYEEQGGIEVQVKGAGLGTVEPIQESLLDQQAPTHYPANDHEYYLLELQRGPKPPFQKNYGQSDEQV